MLLPLVTCGVTGVIVIWVVAPLLCLDVEDRESNSGPFLLPVVPFVVGGNIQGVLNESGVRRKSGVDNCMEEPGFSNVSTAPLLAIFIVEPGRVPAGVAVLDIAL